MKYVLSFRLLARLGFCFFSIPQSRGHENIKYNFSNGIYWGSLAQVFLDERCLELQEKIDFAPEADMFCAYSEDKAALADFILRFKKACEDKSLILDLFSRAELD